MIAAPAVDLRGGRCVQLVGGRPEDERVSLPDPVAVAERWWSLGFGTLHLVDLDAALGHGDHLAVLEKLLGATAATTQVGGGVRDGARIDALLAAGADRVIVGTKAIDEPDWLATEAERNPGRIMIALDTRAGRVLRKGWTEDTGIEVERFLGNVASLPLAGVLSTDVGREGKMEGIDRASVGRVIEACPHPTWISGGVTTMSELEYLEDRGATGAVLGMALYTETLDPDVVAPRWGGRTEPTTDTTGGSKEKR
ncbi:MAG: 1-(5-phosphoribosyl)-5-[(5-phosphoribosylamino)methylideneamino] imidazole-4-carboxamide isomerase [Gemmatimonadota bacterium]|nr:1-(5-phosphoribosyl)-5-[(5-phosphoribosylamino)methylideneamino] imidazole-4-carboxamide isomerase [Gemmatimonadota bacterium]